MLLLKSPIYTIKEKYAYVEKYLYDLQLSYAYGKSYCNHDVMIESGTNNYFEREKHVNEFLNKLNDPLYMPINLKFYSSHGYIVDFTSHACNYYERGGDKCPLYALNNFKLQVPTIVMHGYVSVF